MKISALLLLPSLIATVDAFTVAPSTPPTFTSAARVPIRSTSVLRESATAETETKDERASVYAAIGIDKEELALGVNPEEVLEWIGTRAEMVEKVMEDIDTFDRDRAELEVGKYLMDPEAMNYHIEFKKKLADDPSIIQPEEKEGLFSFRNFVILYFIYFGGEVVYKKTPLHDMVDLTFVPGWGARVVEEASFEAAAQSTVDAASSVADAVSNSI